MLQEAFIGISFALATAATLRTPGADDCTDAAGLSPRLGTGADGGDPAAHGTR